MIIAIDIGSKCGYCTKIDNNLIYGCLDTSKYIHGQRYYEFYQLLNTLKSKNINNESIEIVYEHVNRHLGTIAAHVYGGFLAILLLFAYENNYKVYPLSVQQIKKYISDNNRASKQEVIDSVNNKLKINIKNDNIADAIAIYLCHTKG